MEINKKITKDNKTTNISKLEQQQRMKLQELASLNERIRQAENKQKQKKLARARQLDNHEKSALGGLVKAVNLDRFRMSCVNPRTKHNLDIELITGALLNLSQQIENLTQEQYDLIKREGHAFLQTRPKDRNIPGKRQNSDSTYGEDTDELGELGLLDDLTAEF